jgi:hypothetical protein
MDNEALTFINQKQDNDAAIEAAKEELSQLYERLDALRANSQNISENIRKAKAAANPFATLSEATESLRDFFSDKKEIKTIRLTKGGIKVWFHDEFIGELDGDTYVDQINRETPNHVKLVNTMSKTRNVHAPNPASGYEFELLKSFTKTIGKNSK